MEAVPYRRKLNENDMTRMNIPRRYWRVNFGGISELAKWSDEQKKEILSPRDFVGNYVKEMSEHWSNGVGLYLWGPNGCGKTSISVCLAKEFRRRGHTTLFIESAMLKQKIINSHQFDGTQSYMDRAVQVDVLIIDDLGKGTADRTGFGARMIDELIRARNARQVITIATSNMNPRDEEFSETFILSTLETMKECMIPYQVVGENQRDATGKKLRDLTFNKDS